MALEPTAMTGPVLRSFEASAPGKAFLIGEYAALEGSPAVVLAVQRRMKVRAEVLRIGGWRLLEAAAPERVTSLADLTRAAAEDDLVAAVVRCLNEAHIRLPENLRLTSDRRELLARDGHPLGLGSSAAAAVALTAVLLAVTGAPRTRVQRLAIEAHRSFQGGVGSGYDVACSMVGGLIVARPGGDRAHVSVESVQLPPGLAVVLAGARPPLSTPSAVARLRESASRTEVRRTLAALADLAERATEALLKPGEERIIESMRRYAVTEAKLGQEIGVTIVTPRTRAVADAIERLGGACKPSGAGGDELVVALVPNDAQEAAISLLAKAGFEPVKAGIDRVGLRVS